MKIGHKKADVRSALARDLPNTGGNRRICVTRANSISLNATQCISMAIVLSLIHICRFLYLGSMVNENNDISEKISKIIQNANRSYYGLMKYIKSQLVHRETKARLYRTLVKPVLK